VDGVAPDLTPAQGCGARRGGGRRIPEYETLESTESRLNPSSRAIVAAVAPLRQRRRR
jgi:hypothetical protein